MGEKGRDHSGDLDVDGDNIKMDLRGKRMGGCGLDSYVSR
jgi:hypothetical protein